ncbi:hypothetical protein Btru_046620 [Bulinus truncatus]|nr:hypothetical protein Btru_046620 [Bulinus truncatus]
MAAGECRLRGTAGQIRRLSIVSWTVRLDGAGECRVEVGTTLVGCVMNLTQGLHNLGFNETNNSTAAYTSSPTGSRYSFCHSLGTADSLKDVPVRTSKCPCEFYKMSMLVHQNVQVRTSKCPCEFYKMPITSKCPCEFYKMSMLVHQNVQVRTSKCPCEFYKMSMIVHQNVQAMFPALQYLQLNESDQFRHPLLPNVTTTTSSTSAQTTSAATTDSTTTAITTQSSAAYDTATTSQTVVTITTQSVTSPTVSFESTSRLATTASVNETLVECRSFQVKNLSRNDLVALLSTLQTELLVAKTTVSAYRQKHYSVWENRPSCHAIGISGILIVTSCIACLSSADIFRLAKFLVTLRGDKSSHGTNKDEEEKKINRNK